MLNEKAKNLIIYSVWPHLCKKSTSEYVITNKQLTFMKMSQNINTGHYFKKTYAVFLFSYFSPPQISKHSTMMIYYF